MHAYPLRHSLDAVDEVVEYRRDLSAVGAGRAAVVEAAVLRGQRQDSRDLDLEDFPASLTLHVLPLFQSIVHEWVQLIHQVTGEMERYAQ